MINVSNTHDLIEAVKGYQQKCQSDVDKFKNKINRSLLVSKIIVFCLALFQAFSFVYLYQKFELNVKLLVPAFNALFITLFCRRIMKLKQEAAKIIAPKESEAKLLQANLFTRTFLNELESASEPVLISKSNKFDRHVVRKIIVHMAGENAQVNIDQLLKIFDIYKAMSLKDPLFCHKAAAFQNDVRQLAEILSVKHKFQFGTDITDEFVKILKGIPTVSCGN